MPDVAKPATPISNVTPAAAIPDRFPRDCANDPALRERWEGSTAGLNDTTRSGLDMSMVALLVNRDYNDEDIAAILLRYPHGKASEEGTRYIARMLTKARDKAQRAAPPGRGSVAADADHFRIATALIERLDEQHGTPPVYTLGQFWVVEQGLWAPRDVDKVASFVGEWFGGLKFCRRGSDFKSVAWLAAQQVADEHYFEGSAIGIACPENFWTVDGDGGLRSEPLRPDHRARTRVAAEPDFDAKAPKFEALLTTALGPEQRELLQCLFGAAITRQLWRYRIAGMLLGATTTSKTTLLTILRSLFPKDQVGATTPQNWGSEYYVAALAGKTLNIVGELDPQHPIPGGAFKSVVGNDLIDGRHPTHRPFSFVCQASHFFNCNRLPPTVDRSDAFFVRWRILHFQNRIAAKDIIKDLADHIIAEEIGPVLAWMLRGAQRVAREQALPTTEEHAELITKWRYANNSALQFVTDPDECVLDPEASVDGLHLFRSYQSWATDAGLKPFGRNNFYESLEEGGGRLGIARHDEHKTATFRGLRLNPITSKF
ncbi:MAG: hypothetical protein ACYC9Z_18655 [Casimicrobiaceae bacterium]